MPRADFYLIAKPRFAAQPLLLVCELARRACDGNQFAVVLARDAAQAEELDDLLWAFDPDAYVPHQIAGSDDEDEVTPVLIVAPGTEAPPRRVPRNQSGDSEAEKVWMSQVVDQVRQSAFMKRYGTIDEQAAPILFLASDEASYITGTVLPVAGGDTG